jgi:hypothetical protein
VHPLVVHTSTIAPLSNASDPLPAPEMLPSTMLKSPNPCEFQLTVFETLFAEKV